MKTKRNRLEEAHRTFAIEEMDMEEEMANAKIAKARLAPQKSKRLHSIHQAHDAVLAKEAEITRVEGKLAAARKEYEAKFGTLQRQQCQGEPSRKFIAQTCSIGLAN